MSCSKAQPATKKRKVDLENRAFNPAWSLRYFFVERHGKAQCLICLATVAVFKENNIRRHWETSHHSSKYATMDESSRQTAVSMLSGQLMQQTATLFQKQNSANELATRASFEVALLIAQRMKPFTDGEFIKDCLLTIADTMCPSQRSLFSTVSLSARTVSRRIEEMSADIRSSLHDSCNRFDLFSIALDESTDTKDTSQLAVFVRGVTVDFTVTEEFLRLVPMRGTTTGKDIYVSTLGCLEAAGLDLKRLCSVTTDGAPAMVGEAKGAAALLAKKCIDAGNQQNIRKLHCIIHQEALCAKAATMTEVMSVVVKVVNSILSKSLNHRQFQVILDEAKAEYGDLLYFCEVRWLSRGNMLARVWDLRTEIGAFLVSKNMQFSEEFNDPAWLAKLAFLTDVTEHLNELNRRLQGKDALITDMFAAIRAFQVKLRLWENQLTVHQRQHFPRLSTVAEDVVDNIAVLSVISTLRDEFAARFDCLKECSTDFSIFTSPFSVVVDDLPESIQMEMVELQCSEELRGKFFATSPFKFFKEHLNAKQFPSVLALVRRVVSMFGSTYCCEQLFSRMKYTKSNLRSQLSDQHLEDILLLACSSFQPRIANLCQDRQHQSSH